MLAGVVKADFIRLWSYLEPVSDAPDGFNVLWFGRGIFYFFADFFDVYGNGSNISDGFHFPDFPEKLFFCKYMVWIFRQKCQKIKFLCGKCLFFSVDVDAAGCLVNFQTTDLNSVIAWDAAGGQPLVTLNVATSSPGLKGFVI